MSEAHACGTPVVSFNTCGLPDIGEHQFTGYLAKAFDNEDLAIGNAWVLTQRETGRLFKQASKLVPAGFLRRWWRRSIKWCMRLFKINDQWRS